GCLFACHRCLHSSRGSRNSAGRELVPRPDADTKQELRGGTFSGAASSGELEGRGALAPPGHGGGRPPSSESRRKPQASVILAAPIPPRLLLLCSHDTMAKAAFCTAHSAIGFCG